MAGCSKKQGRAVSAPDKEHNVKHTLEDFEEDDQNQSSSKTSTDYGVQGMSVSKVSSKRNEEPSERQDQSQQPAGNEDEIIVMTDDDGTQILALPFHSDGRDIHRPDSTDSAYQKATDLETWLDFLGTAIMMYYEKETGDCIWSLGNFPSGYTLWLHTPPGRKDYYLYGHPKESRFRSPAEFLPHLVSLTRGDVDKCKCCLCDRKAFLAQKKGGNSAVNETKRVKESRESGETGQSEEELGRGVQTKGGPKQHVKKATIPSKALRKSTRSTQSTKRAIADSDDEDPMEIDVNDEEED